MKSLLPLLFAFFVLFFISALGDDQVPHVEVRVEEPHHTVKEKFQDAVHAAAHRAQDKVGETLHNVKDKVEHAVHEAVHNAKDRVEQKLHNVLHNAKEKADDAKDKVEQHIHDAKDKVEQHIHEAKDKVNEKKEEMKEYVEEHTPASGCSCVTMAFFLFVGVWTTLLLRKIAPDLPIINTKIPAKPHAQ